jgi:L-ascorbate metabolism protein UlaG (beta-lactamase superfamily)
MTWPSRRVLIGLPAVLVLVAPLLDAVSAVSAAEQIYPGTHTSRVADRIQNHVMPFFSRSLCFDRACRDQPVARGADTLPARDGDLTIVPIAHASLCIMHGQQVILVDPARFGPGLPGPPRADLDEAARAIKALPVMPAPDAPEFLVSALPVRPEQMARFSGLKPATLILVTDIHNDHLDPRAIAALKTPTTRLIVPPAASTRLLDVHGAETMANGDTRSIAGVKVEAVPMYNTRPDPESGALFHTKGRGNGYVVTVGGKRIYIAGDTACTPEMRALKNIDVAFLPMNLPFTMPPAEAAECAKAMKPRIVYPYHYFDSDPKAFEAALAGTGIEVRLRDWYLGGH